MHKDRLTTNTGGLLLIKGKDIKKILLRILKDYKIESNKLDNITKSLSIHQKIENNIMFYPKEVQSIMVNMSELLNVKIEEIKKYFK